MNINDLTKKPAVTGLMGLLIGLIIGLPILGWVVWPVEWTDAAFKDLREADKAAYVNLLADSLASDPADLQSVVAGFNDLGAGRVALLDKAIGVASDDMAKARLEQLKTVLATADALKDDTPPAPSLLDQWMMPLLACTLVVVVLAVGGFFWYQSQQPKGPKKPLTAAQQAAQIAKSTERTDFTAAGGATTPTGKPPVAQFMTTYVLGDDLFDDSFSVDSPDGGFLGECGMGIGDTMGVGDPKKVTAFEAWIFDKNDIRTVTKVLMSEHVYRDEALRSKLSAKGEPVLAKPGEVFNLETATLIIQVRVADMAYGGGALPPNSFFERLTVELAAFPKPA
jgi:hypothetical protein